MLAVLRGSEQRRVGPAALGVGLCFALGACGTLLDIGPLGDREGRATMDAGSTDAMGSDAPAGRDVPRLDPTFGQNGTAPLDLRTANALALDGNDGVFVSGSVHHAAGITHVDSRGQIDRTFASGGLFRYEGPVSDALWTVERDEAGRLTAAGVTQVTQSESNLLLLRLDERGVPEATFGDRGVALVPSMVGNQVRTVGGRLWVGGVCGLQACLQEIDLTGRPTARRYAFQLEGAPTTSYSFAATSRAIIASMETDTSSGVFVVSEDGFTASHVLARDGRAFVLPDKEGHVFTTSFVASTATLWLQRFLPSGIPDPSFHDGLSFSIPLPAADVPKAGLPLWLSGAVADQGVLLILAGPVRTAILRITPEGVLDVRFGKNGLFLVAEDGLTAIARDSHDRIVVAGGGRGGTFVRRYVF